MKSRRRLKVIRPRSVRSKKRKVPVPVKVQHPKSYWQRMLKGATALDRTKRYPAEYRLALIFCRAFSSSRGSWTRAVVARITGCRHHSFLRKA